MFWTRIRTNYSFSKLNKEINEIVDESMEAVGEAASKAMRRRIDEGLTPPLTPFTIKRRNMGKGWANADVGTPISSKPLKQTGALYESLEFNKKLEIIDMEHYGIYHDKGHKYSNGVTIPARPFMVFQREANEALNYSDIKKKLEKAFKKGG